MQQNESLKEQRKNYRQLTRVEKTGEELSNITLTTDQLISISRKVINTCRDNGGNIELSKVFQMIIEDIKVILEQKQDEFIASHGIRLVVKDHPIIIRPVAPRDKSRFVDRAFISCRQTPYFYDFSLQSKNSPQVRSTISSTLTTRITSQ